MSEPGSGEDAEVVREFEHEGVKCRVVKIRFNERDGWRHYCGYAELPERLQSDDVDVRWESTYDDKLGLLEADVDVHGGLTYKLHGDGWIGFDYAHSRDHCVDADGESLPGADDYREGDYRVGPDEVEEELRRLAEQLNELPIPERVIRGEEAR